jgi:hypothetical protein
MMNSEVYEKTRRLIRALNIFVLHVFVYFLANISLSLYAFENIQDRWGWLFVIVAWAFILVYHGIRVYGIDPISGKRTPKLLSFIFGTIGA